MKKLCLFIICAFLSGIAFPQYLSKEFTIDDSDVINSVALNVSVSNQDSVVLLDGSRMASGLFVSGCANLENEYESYVRITVRDSYNSDYLVYELYPLLVDTQRCPFSKIGLETAYLDNIQAQSIKIETLNASVTLDSVYLVVPERSSRNMSKAIPNRKVQCENIASKLNERLVAGHKTWRAGLTFVSQMTYEEKKGMSGGKVPVLYGFDYYKGGVFVMPEFYRSVSRNANTRTSDNYVTEWDWRNRHGKNWMTSVKDQNDPVNCKSCWAFSALGTVESYINLYYNKILNIDLAEQELIAWDNNIGDCEGGYVDSALYHVKIVGAIPENDFPYIAQNCLYDNIINQNNRIKIGGFSDDYFDSYKTYHSTSYLAEEDSIKRMLFRSPITFGIYPWTHFVEVIGYKQIQSGEYYYISEDPEIIDTIPQNDPLIGHTAWLFKNSYGTDWGNNGFGYIAMSLADAYGIHKLTGNVTCSGEILLTDNDIVCEDVDGDGYFNWGIGERPTLPAWAPLDEDGDDSDCTKGPINEFGNLLEIASTDTIFIDYSDYDTYSSPQYIHQHIKLYNEALLTISSIAFCRRGVSITIERGSTLYIEEGGVLENVILKPEPGSHIIIEDGGRIKHNKDVSFRIPIGVTLELNHGKIE